MFMLFKMNHFEIEANLYINTFLVDMIDGTPIFEETNIKKFAEALIVASQNDVRSLLIDIISIANKYISNSKESLQITGVDLSNVKQRYLSIAFIISTIKYFTWKKGTLDENYAKIIHDIVVVILQVIKINELITVHLLNALQQILKDHGSVLNTTLLLSVLDAVYKLSLIYKNQTDSIVPLIIRNLKLHDKEKLCYNIIATARIDYKSMVVLPVLLKDISKECLWALTSKIILLIARCYKEDRFDVIKLYVALISRYSFDEFERNICPHFLNNATVGDLNDRNYQFQLERYFVSQTVNRYGSSLYGLTQNTCLPTRLKAYIMYRTIKSGFHDKNLCKNEIVSCLKLNNFEVSTIGFKILCTFTKKQTVLDDFYFTHFIKYLNTECWLNNRKDLLENFNFFISYLIISSNNLLDNNACESTKTYARHIKSVRTVCVNNIKSGNSTNIEVGAEMYRILMYCFLGASDNLKLFFNLNQKDQYGLSECPFYKYLLSEINLFDKQSLNLLISSFLNYKASFPILIEIVRTYYLLNGFEDFECDQFKSLFNGLVKMTASNSGEKAYLCLSLYLDSQVYKNVDIKNENMTDVEICLNYSVVTHLLLTNNYCTLNNDEIKYMITCYQDIVDKFIATKSIESKHEKYLQGILISCAKSLRILVTMKDATASVLHQVLIILQKITKCNKKSPVSTAGLELQYICSFYLKPNINIKLESVFYKILQSTLTSIHDSPVDHVSTIRCSPEYSILIEKFCTADKRKCKPFLEKTLAHLLNILNDQNTSASSKTVTLNILGKLISNNAIRGNILPHIETITIACIEIFSKSNWEIKNASLQVFKNIIILFDTFGKSTSIEEIFFLYPNISLYFYKMLIDESSLHGSAILVLIFFSSFPNPNNVFGLKETKLITQVYFELFAHMAKTFCGFFAKLAANAYVSICEHKHIPLIILDLVDYIKNNLSCIKANTLDVLTHLIQQLYFKYLNEMFEDENEEQMKVFFYNLSNYLLKYTNKCEQFLALRFETVEVTSEKIINLISIPCNYDLRLWLRKNVIYVVSNIKLAVLPSFLNKCLNKLSPSLQMVCLDCIVNRHLNIQTNRDVLNDIINLLIKTLFSLDMYFDVTVAYVSVIFLLNDLGKCTFFDAAQEIRKNYLKAQQSIYILSVYTLVFSSVPFCDNDLVFSNYVLVTYMNAIKFKDEDLLLHVASTVKYLYKIVAKENYCDLLKLVLCLLLKNSFTGNQMCKLFSEICRENYDNVFVFVERLLKFNNLLLILDNCDKVYDFLVDVAIYISNISDEFEESDECFYLVQTETININKYVIKKILFRSFKDYYFYCKNR